MSSLYRRRILLDMDERISYKKFIEKLKYNLVVLYNSTANLLSNVLTLDNIEPYTPTEDYHPATKKYVDDSVPYLSYNSNIGALEYNEEE